MSECSNRRIPLLASPPRSASAAARSLLNWAQTGWFSFLFQSEHHPGLAKADASRYLIDRRPPLLLLRLRAAALALRGGGARRGICAYSWDRPELHGIRRPER